MEEGTEKWELQLQKIRVFILSCGFIPNMNSIYFNIYWPLIEQILKV